MSKKGPGTRDHRSEPDSEGSSQNYRVDRVFAPARPAPRPTPSQPGRPAATKPPTIPPPLGTAPPPTMSRTSTGSLLPAGGDSDTELSLRRQLSRLQRQLADAQRELANKDDEVATAVEKRLEIQAAYDVILEEQRQMQLAVDEAIADRARSTGVEQRLQEANAAADELRHQLERERTERATLAVQFDEAQAAFEKARVSWREESASIDEQHIAQIAQLEQAKKQAVEAAETAMKTSTERQYQAHEAELEALKAAHARALAALRGEMEPKVAEARNLGAEIERLNSQLQAQAAEHQNLIAERVELHTWEMQQQIDAHAAEMAQLSRQHATETARLNEEVAAANQAGQLIERNSSLREKLWEQTVTSLRDSQKKLQQEVAEARERAAQAEASKWSVETRLVGTLQALDKSNEHNRKLSEQLEVEQEESRRNAIDRQRFAAYLEEGLAMLGALPAPQPNADDSMSLPVEPDAIDDAINAAEPEAIPDEEAHSRPTASFPAISDDDPEIEASHAPVHDEPEAEPLPEPTRP